jgi:antitoxin YefM
MDSISVNKFRDNIKSFVEQVAHEHIPLKVTRRNGGDFVVLSADDWAREQETLYVSQNNNLMKQIAASMKSNVKNKGYKPTSEEINEITSI